MREVLDHPLTQYLILLLAVVAGIVALKTAVAYLSDGGITGSIKRVVMAV